MQVVLADRVEPGKHPALVDRLFDGFDVPPAPHLAEYAVIFLDDQQPERINRRIVGPPGILEAVRHRFQRVKQRVSVELVRVRHVVLQIAKHPVALIAQDVPDRLFRRAHGRLVVPGHHARRDLPEHDPVLQRINHMLQLNGRRVGVVGFCNALYPPGGSASRLLFIIKPAGARDASHVQGDHCRRAVAFLQGNAQALCRNLPLRCYAVPAQKDHYTYPP